MKKNSTYKSFFAIAFLSAICLTANGQELPKVFGRPVHSVNPDNGTIRCVSTEYEEYQQETNPKKETRAQFEDWMTNKIKERQANRSSNSVLEVITIPVVVHVIHNGDALGSNENIRDAQVLSQIEVLNQDYRRMLNTPGYNDNEVGADIEINFCMAQVDPNGNPTNGIDRVNMGIASFTIDDFDDSVKTSTYWDPEQYFNIWTCNFGGDSSDILGYAQFPSSSRLGGLSSNGGDASTDGVVIGYKYFGSKDIYSAGNYGSSGNQYRYGRTATHEVGHALGLRHIWGDNNSCTVNATDSEKDYCPDTPAQNEEHYDCETYYDTCLFAAGEDMTANYMDYSNDTCMNIFTQDQKERIRTVMQNSPRRASLITSTVCQAPVGGTDKFKLHGLNVHPNPTQGYLTISVDNGDMPDSYTIYNSVGQTVSIAKVNTQANLTINTSGYANGIYFIKIDKAGESKTLKFIKN